eukprot:TRINITY_DN10592_c0_g1_i1.p1 TRINITY_DN10592_c0_g1~~TRINITY_DN10592_c0_g1_i1.p1  ORF type:complete len:674 (-),score=144.77 TRINITY_DN10592_c0_g1_i1:136-2157(-)
MSSRSIPSPRAASAQRRASLQGPPTTPKTVRRMSVPSIPIPTDSSRRRSSIGTPLSARSEDKGVNVVVCVRCRPATAAEQKIGQIVTCDYAEKQVTVLPSKTIDQFTRSDKVCPYDHVFGPESTQSDVYVQAVRPLVGEFVAGYNTTVFAYGQTGAGKTYTMEGPSNSGCKASSSAEMDEHAGMIQRAVRDVFERLSSTNAEYTMQVSCVELYNEEIIDLMSPAPEKLKIFESPDGVMTVKGMEEKTVYTVADIMQVIARCKERRHVAETLMNAQSSRSHCVFSVQLNVTESDEQDPMIRYVRVSKLNLVDLAGSECVGRSGGRKDEAGKINQSLLTLGRVIQALADAAGHIPYRESNLTRLLKDSLGGGTRTCMIAAISPAASALDETISTLDYATRARCIVTRPTISKRVSPEEMILKLQRELEKMRAAQQDGTASVDAERERLLSADINKWRERAEDAETQVSTLQEEIRKMHEMMDAMKRENEMLKSRRHSFGGFGKENSSPQQRPCGLSPSQATPSTPTHLTARRRHKGDHSTVMMSSSPSVIENPYAMYDAVTAATTVRSSIAEAAAAGCATTPLAMFSSCDLRPSSASKRRLSLGGLGSAPTEVQPFDVQQTHKKTVSFLAFCTYVRKTQSAMVSRLSTKDFVKMVSAEWKKLPEEEKRQFKSLAV